MRLEVAPCPGRVIYSMHPPIDLKDASILSPALRVRMEKVKQGGRPYMPKPAQRLQGMCQQAFVHDEVSRGLVDAAAPEELCVFWRRSDVHHTREALSISCSICLMAMHPSCCLEVLDFCLSPSGKSAPVPEVRVEQAFEREFLPPATRCRLCVHFFKAGD